MNHFQVAPMFVDADEALMLWQAAGRALKSGNVKPLAGRYYVLFLSRGRAVIDPHRITSLRWRRLPRRLKARVFGKA